MHNVTVGRYQVSIMFLVVLVAVIVGPIVVAATYLWASRIISFVVDEPLSVTDCPTGFRVHPGENRTLDVTIFNSANVDYSVILLFSLNDTVYQESYVVFSNYTYLVEPGSNDIQAWISIDKKAAPVNLEIHVAFYRE